jgi:hypothetical protein
MAQFMRSKRVEVVQVAQGLIGESYADHVVAPMFNRSVGDTVAEGLIFAAANPRYLLWTIK